MKEIASKQKKIRLTKLLLIKKKKHYIKKNDNVLL